jgi:hypothetical protein
MTLTALSAFGKPIIYGLGFYQSFRYSRSLAVGWKEQRGLCTIDHIGNLAMMVIMGYANMEALRGTKFANRVWRLSYSTYALVPLLHYVTKHMEAKAHRTFEFEELSREYRSDGIGDERSLGQRIQDYWFVDGVPRGYAEKFAKAHRQDTRTYEKRIKDHLASIQNTKEIFDLYEKYHCCDEEELASLIAKDESGGSGRLAALVRKFRKEGNEDLRPLGERIDTALQDHEMSNCEKTVKDVCDFCYVHITDFVLLASVVHTVAALYIGFNRASNLTMLAFYGWAVAEQGMFWTKPEEDKGPLMSFMNGDIVRGYDRYVTTVTSYLGLPFQFFYKGIIGKLTALVSVLIRFTPQSWKSALIPDAVKKAYAEIMQELREHEGDIQVAPTPPIGEKTRITGKYVIPFKDLHLLDGAGDENPNLFPNQTLDQVKQNLVATLHLQEQDQELQVLNAMETFSEISKGDHISVRVKNIFGMLAERGAQSRRDILDKYETYCNWGLISDWNIKEFERGLMAQRMYPVLGYQAQLRAYRALLMPASSYRQGGSFTVTQKMFEVFKLEDQFKDLSLTDLENALQEKLAQSIELNDPYMQEQNWQECTHQKMLEELIGTGGQKGYLHLHVVASRDPDEKQEKEIFLKNIFGAILASWEERRRLLVDRHGDFLCRTATGSTMQQLAYEVYPDVISKDKSGAINPCQNRVDTGIRLILQHRRNRLFSSGTQGGAYMLLKHQDEIEREMAEDREKRFEQVRNGGADGNGEGYLGNARAYGIAGLQYGAYEFAKQAAAGIGTSRHVNNLVAVVLAKNLGLSFYEEARRDIEIQMQHYFLDISLIDELAEYLTPITDIVNRQNFLIGGLGEVDDKENTVIDELIEAIIRRADPRLRFEDIREYIYSRFEDAMADAAAVEIPSDHLDVECIETAYETYERQAKAFLQKYLPQVLYDLSFIDEVAPSDPCI